MSVEIACFAKRARDRMGGISIFERPGLGAVAAVAIGAVAARSAAFPATTRFLRVDVSDPCRIEFGDGAVEATGASEYFSAGEHTVAVAVEGGATHLSVIQP